MNEEKKNAPTRPLCLALEDARAEIFSVINMTAKRHNIPFYLLESIMQEATRQVVDCAKKEREIVARDYEQQLAEYKKREEIKNTGVTV